MKVINNYRDEDGKSCETTNDNLDSIMIDDNLDICQIGDYYYLSFDDGKAIYIGIINRNTILIKAE